jgi:hypothetical protein
MANLFALTGELISLQQQVMALAESPDAGDEDLSALLNAEADGLDAFFQKADGYCWARDAYLASAATRREHAARLMAMAAEDERQAERLLNTLSRAMAKVAPDQRTWKLAGHTVARRKSEAVVIDVPIDELPAAFKKTRTETIVSKTDIKAALKAGNPVPGARIEERLSWSIK